MTDRDANTNKGDAVSDDEISMKGLRITVVVCIAGYFAFIIAACLYFLLRDQPVPT